MLWYLKFSLKYFLLWKTSAISKNRKNEHGYPVQHTILSATVLAPTCAMADAFATSFMVMGLDSARALLTRHTELDAYLIYDSLGTYRTFTTLNN